jgi:hypothetical protein
VSPKLLVAEGPMPGRPSLLGARIFVRNDEGGSPRIYVPGVVIHEDTSGVILRSAFGHEVSFAYPFNYGLLEDPK